jgi:hypothetical protein
MGIPNNHSNPARAISASYVSDCVATGEPRPSSRQDQHRLAGGRDDEPYGGAIEAWEVGADFSNVKNNRPELMERVGLL